MTASDDQIIKNLRAEIARHASRAGMFEAIANNYWHQLCALRAQPNESRDEWEAIEHLEHRLFRVESRIDIALGQYRKHGEDRR